MSAFVESPLSACVARVRPAHLLLWRDPDIGLEAVLALDDLTLGPAAGGIRTRPYATLEDAADDAMALARAMTLKCAIGGLAAGGGKLVVRQRPDMDRAAVFSAIGRRVASLGGLFRTAGDLGTTLEDLRRVAAETGFVHLEERALAGAVARGLVRCVEAARAAWLGEAPRRGLAGLSVAVQGAGVIGAAACARLVADGARVLVADVDAARAARVAAETGATVVSPDEVCAAEVDVFAPCAVGGVVDLEVARSLRARAVVGAANNVLATPEAEDALAARGVWFVPDFIASGGAVVDGIGETVMGLADRGPLVDALGAVAHRVLVEARASGARATVVAERHARARIAAAATTRG
jgi:leucine dehydrogenase